MYLYHSCLYVSVVFLILVNCERDFSALSIDTKTPNEPVFCEGATGEWKRLGLETESLSAIAIHPANPHIIYAGTMFNFSAGINGKLFKSTDCGATWDTLIQTGSYRDILFDPTDADIIYAVSGAILRSSDAGSTWELRVNGIRIDFETSVGSLAIDPQNPEILYAGTGGFFGGTLYKSTDAGNNWNDLASGDTLTDGIISLAIDPENTDIIYAGSADRGRVYKTTNGGLNWEVTGLGDTGSLIPMVAVSPVSSNIVYAGIDFEGLFVSEDAGVTWQREAIPDSVEGFFSLAFTSSNPPDLYLATHLRCYFKEHNCDVWEDLNEGFPDHDRYLMDIKIDPAGINLYAAMRRVGQNNGGLHVRRIFP